MLQEALLPDLQAHDGRQLMITPAHWFYPVISYLACKYAVRVGLCVHALLLPTENTLSRHQVR